VLKRRLAREKVLEFFANLPPCLIGLEACGAAHYWARELRKLGHEVRLMPPQYVRPYVKTNKHDAADAGPVGSVSVRSAVQLQLGISQRELQVLGGISQGLSNADIGRELYLSDNTVKCHARRLFGKLGVHERAHAVALAYRSGLFACSADVP